MLDLNNSPFFLALPILIQESVMQSGIRFDDEEHLRKYSEGLGVHPKD